jgi:uncharacterized protein
MHTRPQIPVGLKLLLFLTLGALTGGGVETADIPPEPRYAIRLESNVMVPMRDSVRLATDLYFPVEAGEKLPVILIRTPYDKHGNESSAKMFAGQGYVAAVQDVRGKFASEGVFTLSENDTNDGADTVTWMATQPWSTGKIGTYGCSYLGEAQIEMSKVRVPQHAAMIAQAAGGAYRFAAFMEGGVLTLSDAARWFRQNGSKLAPSARHPNLDPERISVLPVIDILKNTGPPTDFEEWVAHEPGRPWWDRLGYVDQRHHFNVPAIHVSSWYDTAVKDTLDLFNLFQKNSDTNQARQNQYVIISPTSHCQSEKATEATIVGERNMGDARFEYYNWYLRWFDYWLRGVDNGVTRMPKVQFYVMGANRWRTSDQWPLPNTRFTRYYLHSSGKANSLAGDGVLSAEEPDREPSDHFTYDPMNPVPAAPEAADQSPIEKRGDVLVYTTPVLEKGAEVTGPIEVVLYVSSSAKDTDFTAKLVNLAPDGKAYILQQGILRARYRDGLKKKVWMKPSESYRLKIDLHATSNYFPPGHRIRLEVSSSAFPTYERNLNTGGPNYNENRSLVAENQVHHSKGRASYALLPLIP